MKNKIYDCITFYNANLLFEIRFHILKDIVDYWGEEESNGGIHPQGNKKL